MRETIVIIGFGWVGQANALALRHMGYEVSYYDPAPPALHYAEGYQALYESIPLLAYPLEKDSADTWYMVCVGDTVSPEGIQDISRIENALTMLREAAGRVVLRSTILPDKLESLQFDYYIPEFLHEKGAVAECITPHYFVVGSRQNHDLPSFVKQWASVAGKTFYGAPEQASYIKYLSNLWNSTRVAFINEFAFTISEPLSEYNLQYANDAVNFIFEQKDYLRYGRAFGGHCLPKDTRAFTHWYKEKGFDMHLLEAVSQANDVHVQRQKDYALLPEWYSGWQRSLPSGRVALRALRTIFLRKLQNLNPFRYL
jgi:UDP-glucose 6-dehydrogenase